MRKEIAKAVKMDGLAREVRLNLVRNALPVPLNIITARVHPAALGNINQMLVVTGSHARTAQVEPLLPRGQHLVPNVQLIVRQDRLGMVASVKVVQMDGLAREVRLQLACNALPVPLNIITARVRPAALGNINPMLVVTGIHV